MKKEFLEYLIRECVKEVLEAFPTEPDTVGAPAPPAAGQGTADQPAIPKSADPQGSPLMSVDVKGLWYVDPKKPDKPTQLNITAKDPSSLERELYRTASRSGGPRLKIAGEILRDVPKLLANPSSGAMFLYVGKRNPDDADDDLYLLYAPTYEKAKSGSVVSGVSAQHPTFQQEPKEPGISMPQSAPQAAAKTMAPDIDEAAKFRNMISSMIREALSETKR